MEDASMAAKRSGVSRRAQATNEEMNPMLLPTQSPHTGSSSNNPFIPSAPRSGPILLPPLLQFSVRDRTDATAKRRYSVNVPTRMILILVLVFVVVPLMIFFYKEVHIHDDHHEAAHFKAEKYVNVNTKDVMSHFLDGNNQKNHTNTEKSSASSKDELPPQDTQQQQVQVAIGNVTKTHHTASSKKRQQQQLAESKNSSVSSKKEERMRYLRQITS